MHIKMLQNRAIKIIQRLKHKLAKRWTQFVNVVRRNADAEDANLMYLDDLVSIL